MKRIINRAYQFLLFFIFLKSLSAWFTWNFENWLLVFYVGITMAFVLINKSELFFQKNFAILLLYIIALFSLGFVSDLTGSLVFLCQLFPLAIFIITSNKFKALTLKFITRYWLFILMPSLFFFLLSFIIELPNLGQIENSSWDMYVYTNYVIFIKGQFYDIRFNSIFLEPGHLGMILSFFLFAYRFDFSKWEVKCMLVVLLFTLSLAGYILVFVGYSLSLISQKKNFYRFIITTSLILGSIYIAATVYNGGNNVLNVLIVSRLEFDDEKGISGNNRTSTIADDYFEEILLSNKVWWGLSGSLLKEDNLGAGWKVFIIRYGLVPMFFFFLFYYTSARKFGNDKKYNLLFLILLIATFIQRSYPWWDSWTLPYFCGISQFYSVNRFKVLKKEFYPPVKEISNIRVQ
jgi:hypothetical protein